jgi:hypothetical protein
MALGNNSSALFVDLRNGKVMRYSKTNEIGTFPIVNSKGETRYYFMYDYIEGHVTNFSTREEEIAGKVKLKFQVHLTDQGENYILKMDVDSSYFRMFCCVLPNIDWNYPVRFIPRMKEENGIKKSSLIVVNNGNPMKFAFTKDNPNGKPDVTFTKNKKGEIIDIDREEEQKFFFALIAKAKSQLVHPAVAQDAPSTAATSGPKNGIIKSRASHEEATEDTFGSEPFTGEDDLPF